jgi:hypothetical protein
MGREPAERTAPDRFPTAESPAAGANIESDIRSALQRPCSASAAYYGAANDAEHDQIIFDRVVLFIIQALVNEAGNDMNFETRDKDVAWIRKLSP